MKILIVGGTGLISTAITRQLLQRGDTVTHFNRGRSESRYAGGDPAGGVPGAGGSVEGSDRGAGEVRRLQGDRRDFPRFEAQVQAAGPFDCVVDMICFTPEEAESLLRAVRGLGPEGSGPRGSPHVIFCSTVDVYARPVGGYPIREDAALGGVSEYGKKKARCEALLMDAHRRGEVRLTIIRPAQTYGEGRDIIHTFGRGTVFFDRLRKGKKVIVHGDGTSLWVACHIDDVARAFLDATGNARAFGKAYNATGEEWMTWNRYTEAVAEAIGAPPPKIVHIPTDLLARVVPQRARVTAENFQFPNVFDTGAARADLGFRYTIPFVEGVRRTVAWLDARGMIADSDDDPEYDRLIDAWERLGADMVRALGGAEDARSA